MDLAQEILRLATAHNVTIATAESCTGGMVAVSLTDASGSSAVFDRGFVTYSNAAKTAQLGVPASMIDQFGAVSAEVAEAMAMGAIKNSNSQLSVSITGIAGPSGGSPDKPVGLVYFGLSYQGHTKTFRQIFTGDRAQIRTQARDFALSQLHLVLMGLSAVK